jgi:hypothetical protein
MLILLQSLAFAGNEDVVLTNMTEWHGERVGEDLHPAYMELVTDLGVMVSNKPVEPANTLGASGFDFEAGNTFVFLLPPSDGTPSAWMRANADQDAGTYQIVPRIGARKGLPMSLEFGANASWLGFSKQSAFGAYGRVGLVEGWKPYPDITLQVGYAGYVGNDQLDLGVTDLGVTLGQKYAFGSLPPVRNAYWSPWISYQLLRVRAAPLIDADAASDIGATSVGRPSDPASEPAVLIHELGGGFVISNGTVLIKFAGSWAVYSLPTATAGMGFTW